MLNDSPSLAKMPLGSMHETMVDDYYLATIFQPLLFNEVSVAEV